MIEILNNFSNILRDNLFFSPVLAFIGGIIASFSPCSFSQIPLLLMYLSSEDSNSSGYSKTKNNNLKYTVFYSIGNVITFAILGLVASLLGIRLLLLSNIFYLIFGILIIIVSLQMLSVLNKFSCKLFNPITKKKGVIGAIIFGCVGGLFASPCSTPVLIAILALSTTLNNILLSIVLLILYGFGHSIIYILVGGSFVGLEKIENSVKLKKISNALRIIFALLIFAIGLYLIYLALI